MVQLNDPRQRALSLLDKIITESGDDIPDGWMTRDEFASLWRLHQSRTSELLNRALERGLVERKKFRVMRDRIRHVFHYREITNLNARQKNG